MPETKRTFCRICEAACGLVATVDRGRVLALAPDPDHVVSRGYACVKGIRYADFHASRDRLRHPIRRDGDRWVSATWPAALADVGARLRRVRDEHGPDAIGIYYGNPIAFSSVTPFFVHGLAEAIGTRNLWSAGSQDCNNKFVVSEHMYGSPAIQPIPDLDRTRCLVLIGTNPAVSHMSFVQAPRPIERLRAIEARGGRVFVVDPRRNETARTVGTHVPIRPDTDVFFLLAFLHEVLATGGAELDARASLHARGLGELRALVDAHSPEVTADVTGISAESLRDMVRVFAAAEGASLYAGTGLNQGSHGTLAFWILSVINAVTGNLDREGGALVARGLVDIPRLLELVRFGEGPPSRIGGLPRVLGTLPAGLMPDEMLDEGAGRVRALIVIAGNPLLSCPDEARMQRALERLDTLVSIDVVRNETANLGQYVLAAQSFLERPDMPLSIHGFQPTPYLQYTAPVVAADGEQREEWWILTALAHAMGRPLFGQPLVGALVSLFRGLEELGAPLPESSRPFLEVAARLAGTSLDALERAHPSGVLRPANEGGTFLGTSRVRTADGLVDLAPRAFLREARACLGPALARARKPSLRSISKREHFGHNSWFHNVEAFVDRQPRGNAVWLHPDDAARAGVGDGELAEVASETASVVLPVRVSRDVTPGAVALPHGWGHARADGLSAARRAPGANVNRLAASGPDALERLSGMAHLNGIEITIRRAEASA